MILEGEDPVWWLQGAFTENGQGGQGVAQVEA